MNYNLLSAASDPGGGGESGNFTNPFLKESSLEGLTGKLFLEKLLPRGVGLLFVFGAVAFFFMFIWGAITWILSGGDKTGVESAKNKITNALIGFVLMIGVFAVINLIERFFDINILSIDIGPLIIR